MILWSDLFIYLIILLARWDLIELRALADGDGLKRNTTLRDKALK